jgi:hypothetical protein
LTCALTGVLSIVRGQEFEFDGSARDAEQAQNDAKSFPTSLPTAAPTDVDAAGGRPDLRLRLLRALRSGLMLSPLG